MENSSPPILNILDMTRIIRKNAKKKTYSKACYMLSCRIRGESLFFYNGKHFEVKTGDILYIPFGSTYSQECKSEEIVCFHLEAYSSLPDKMFVFRCENEQSRDRRCTLFTDAYSAWESKEENYKYRCMSLLYEILAEGSIKFSESKKSPQIIKEAVDYLEVHLFDHDLSIEKICAENNLSRAYFNKLFKYEYGLTPVEYINKQRIKKARFFLDSGNYTNEEIAQLCGFNNIKYFYVVFKRITGLTTKEYRAIDPQ